MAPIIVLQLELRCVPGENYSLLRILLLFILGKLPQGEAIFLASARIKSPTTRLMRTILQRADETCTPTPSRCVPMIRDT